MDHLDEFTLLRLVDRELDDQRRTETERHLSSCVSCLRRFEGLQAETLVISSALWDNEGKIPQPFRPRSELPWLAAGFLGASAVGLATFWTRILKPTVTGLQSLGVDGSSFASDMFNREVVGRGVESMGQLILEFVVLAIIVTAVYGLARGKFGRRGGAGAYWIFPFAPLLSSIKAFGLTTGLALSLLVAPADAAVVEWNEAVYVLSEDEVIDNDLIVACEDIRIEGTVLGDLIVFGRHVRISGRVEGDVIGAAQEIEIGGTVGGNVRTVSQVLEIQGAVHRNVSAVAERLFLEPEATVAGSLTGAGREVRVRTAIPRDVTVAAARTELDAAVSGSIRAVGDSLTVGPKASVGGKVNFYGAEAPDVSPDAKVGAVEFQPIEREDKRSLGDQLLAFVLSWAAALGFGAVALWLAPSGWSRIVSHLDRVPWNIAFGIVALIGTPLIAVFLGLTLVGLPISLALVCLYGFSLYGSKILVGHWMGNHLLGAGTTIVQTLTRLAVGLLVVGIARELPYVGDVVSLIFIVWGFGAIVRARLGARHASAAIA